MLTANQLKIDLGTVRNGSPVRFKYTLTNNTNDNISINSITVGCGSCTTASASKNEVAPGEQVEIHTVFTPKSTGLQSKKVSVHATGGTVELKFQANVT